MGARRRGHGAGAGGADHPPRIAGALVTSDANRPGASLVRRGSGIDGLSTTNVKVSDGRAVASSALVTAAAQMTIMAFSGLLGLLILLKFGKNARTDGL